MKLVCANCGKDCGTTTKKNLNKNSVFCGKKCAMEHQSKK